MCCRSDFDFQGIQSECWKCQWVCIWCLSLLICFKVWHFILLVHWPVLHGCKCDCWVWTLDHAQLPNSFIFPWCGVKFICHRRCQYAPLSNKLTIYNSDIIWLSVWISITTIGNLLELSVINFTVSLWLGQHHCSLVLKVTRGVI